MNFAKLNDYITDKIKEKANNLLHRKKRFRRKAYLNKWTHFITFTYDDKKNGRIFPEETARKWLSLQYILAVFITIKCPLLRLIRIWVDTGICLNLPFALHRLTPIPYLRSIRCPL